MAKKSGLPDFFANNIVILAFLKDKPMHIIAILLSAGFLLLLVALPLLAMLTSSESALLWGEMWRDDYYRQRLTWTVFQAALTTIITLILGVPIAWVLARYTFGGRKVVLRLLMLPFVMPTLVAGIGVLALFGHQGALWKGWQDTPYLLLYGNVFFNLPVAVRSAYQGLRQVPAHRLYAARTLGANVWQRFWQVEMPVLRAWLAGGACLVFLYCFSGFGLALLLGGRDYATVEVEIYQLIAYELDMARAGVLVWLVLATTGVAGLLYAWLSRRTHTTHVQTLPLQTARGAMRFWLWGNLALLAFFCALPLLAIVFQAAQAWSAWHVFIERETWLAVGNTLRFSGMAMLLVIVLGVAHATAARRFRMMRALAFLPFMVSPVCLAFGVLLCYPEWAASLPLLVALYALMAYPFVTKDVLAAWDNLPTRYFHAARMLGASRFQAAYLVCVPLLLPALRRGLTFATATCIGEFAASLFLSRPEWQTLTMLIYSYLGKVGQGNYDKALLLTLLLMLLSSVVFLWVDAGDKHEQV